MAFTKPVFESSTIIAVCLKVSIALFGKEDDIGPSPTSTVQSIPINSFILGQIKTRVSYIVCLE